MRNFCITVVIVLVVCGASEIVYFVNASDSTQLLNWAPLHLKSPYMTFLNNFYTPSWRTRHPMTKEEESLRDLQLPRGVPFALVCGACFRRSRLLTNLTVSASGHEYRSVPKAYSKRQTEYRVGDFECLMTYMITAPIESDGTITCILNRGTQRKTESISFDVTDVSIDETPEELEIKNQKEQITLQCPSPDETPGVDNPLVHVWHDQHSDPAEASPITEMRSTISVRRPKYTRHIICSVYNIGQPTKVHQARYRITGSHALAKHEYRVTNDDLNEEDVEEEFPSKRKLSSFVVGIIVIAVIVCVLLAVLGLYRFVSAATRH